MIVSDAAVLQWAKTAIPSWVVDVPVAVNPVGLGPANLPHYGAAALGAAIVLAAGYYLKFNKERARARA